MSRSLIHILFKQIHVKQFSYFFVGFVNYFLIIINLLLFTTLVVAVDVIVDAVVVLVNIIVETTISAFFHQFSCVLIYLTKATYFNLTT